MRINHNLIRSVFTIGAVVGVAATAYFAAKNGDNICDACNAVKNEMELYPDKPSKIKAAVKMAPAVAKVAWKPLVAGGLTYTCMFASHRVTAKQVAALTATCAYVTRNRNYLEGKLKEYVGEDELTKIRKGFVKKEIVEKIVYKETPEISSLCTSEDPGVLCYESIIGRWFRCPEKDILEGENYIKKLFNDDKYCCMNDLYAFWGIAMSHPGQTFGWVNHEDYYDNLEFVNSMLTPEEWDGMGPDGKFLEEPVFVIEPDTWSFPMPSWEEI